jgi:hypothetical protein
MLIVKRFIFRSLRDEIGDVLADDTVKVTLRFCFLTNLNLVRTKITPYVNSQYKRTI